MIEITTRSSKETRKVAALLAGSVKPPLVVALEGNLGAGKTTFVQGFARAQGVKEKIQSPTFVLMKIYPLRKVRKIKHLIHIDCYRLGSPQELLHLGFTNLLKDQDAIILIEWAGRVRKLIPRDALWIKFLHRHKRHERIIKIRT